MDRVRTSAALIAALALASSSCDRRCDDLHAAIVDADQARFDRLAVTGDDLSCADGDDWTLLHSAARYGRDDIIRFLLDHGQNADAPGGVGRTPLYRAAKYGHLDSVRLLMERGGGIDTRSADDFTPLIVAAEHDHTEIVRFLLDHGAAPGAVNIVGRTALIQAIDYATRDDDTLTRLLIERGVPLEVHDINGRTALSAAAQRGRLRIARALLEAGAYVNATRDHGLTPLDVARGNDFDALAELLVQHGGRPGGFAVRPDPVRPLPAQVTRSGVVVRSSGPGAIPVGTHCTVTARPFEGSNFNCQLDAMCGNLRLYGGGSVGFTFCEPTETGARAFNPFGGPTDGNPAAELDTDRRRFVADDGYPGAEGTSVEVRLDERPD